MADLVAAYSAAAQDQGPASWIKLWQKPFSRVVQQAGVVDLVEMWYYVLAGLSARYYHANACPAEIGADGVVTIPLDFYLFPSSLDLQYTLAAALGTLSAPVYEQVPKEFDLVFDQTDEVDLGYLAENYSWQPLSEAYDEYGRPIARPSVNFADGKVRLSASCFWILRVRCLAQGYKYRLTMRLRKYEQEVDDTTGELNWTGYSITNLQASVQATWMDGGELKSAELELEIPPCVEDYLALCEDGEPAGTIVLNHDEPYFIVYYSTCTGNVIDVERIVPWRKS